MKTRRAFLAHAAAGAAAAPLAVAQPPGRRQLGDVEHIHVHGNRITYCGHPRQGGLFYFGRGELAVLHNHAPCAYERPADVQHDHGGYHSRSVLLLQRSTDGGRTWPGENDVEVWNEAAPQEEREKLLLTAFTSPREDIDLRKPDTIAVFPRTFLGPFRYGTSQFVAFALRSPDKGRTWEKVPALLLPPPGCYSAASDNTPIVRLPDDSFVIAVRTSGRRPGIDLYASGDNGLSWHYRTHICDGQGYPALVLLKSGRLQCYHYPLGISYSDDGGKTWSRQRQIVPRAPSPWLKDDTMYTEELAHRSPCPLVLRDGRIILLFARRISEKRGIGLLASDDAGVTWGPDIILRDDAGVSSQTRVNGIACDYSDIGYPLAAELEDGRIFTAYYFIVGSSKLLYGPPRYIAGSYFRLL
jgi:hypothetical protein